MRSFANYLYVNKLLGVVWLINGLFCKLLNLLPRHQEIVGVIFQCSENEAYRLTNLIGGLEVALALVVWYYAHKVELIYGQLLLILTMNILEFGLAQDLLLWGPFNLLWAIIFSAFVLIFMQKQKLKN